MVVVNRPPTPEFCPSPFANGAAILLELRQDSVVFLGNPVSETPPAFLLPFLNIPAIPMFVRLCPILAKFIVLLGVGRDPRSILFQSLFFVSNIMRPPIQFSTWLAVIAKPEFVMAFVKF